MKVRSFQYRSEMAAPLTALWKAHTRPDALRLLTPWWSLFRIRDAGGGISEGSVVEARIGPGPVSVAWRALHTRVRPPHAFVDVAIEGPFPVWVHCHILEHLDEHHAAVRDVVFYTLPSWAPERLGAIVVDHLLRTLFRWRHRATERLARDTRNDYHLHAEASLA